MPVDYDKAGVVEFFEGPGRREAADGRISSIDLLIRRQDGMIINGRQNNQTLEACLPKRSGKLLGDPLSIGFCLFRLCTHYGRAVGHLFRHRKQPELQSDYGLRRGASRAS